MKQSINKHLSNTIFSLREEGFSHLSYEQEMKFYDAVKTGDIDTLNRIMLPLKNEHLGKLSDNPLHNIKYHLIVTIALITRFCIEGGLIPETAYTLSDVYIQKVDKCSSEEEVTALHHEIVYEFANRMNSIKKQSILSKPVVQAIDYINKHLHEKIRLNDLASYLSLNKTYFCGVFKKEMNMTVGQYINKSKIEAAENMLIYTEQSSLEISNYFDFSSHSHFINSFKKETGMTPNEYRKKYYRKHFTED